MALAVNCCFSLMLKMAGLGVTEVVICTTLADAVLNIVVSACEVAVMVTVGGLGEIAGAMYRPAELIVPHGFGLPVHAASLRVQVTAVLLEPVTVAANCCCRVTPTVVVPLGVTLTLTPPPLELLVAEQPRLTARLAKPARRRQILAAAIARTGKKGRAERFMFVNFLI